VNSVLLNLEHEMFNDPAAVVPPSRSPGGAVTAVMFGVDAVDA
jgi:hypothetical protein